MKPTPLLALAAFTVLAAVAAFSAGSIVPRAVARPPVFAAAPTAVVDHRAFDKLLKKHVNARGLVDDKGFRADEKVFNQYLVLISASPPAAIWG